MLLMADHLFEPSLVRTLTTLTLTEDEIALAVDSNTCNPLVDLGDVTRVKMEEGRILDISKGLADFNGFDTGVFLCSPAIFQGAGAKQRTG